MCRLTASGTLATASTVRMKSKNKTFLIDGDGQAASSRYHLIFIPMHGMAANIFGAGFVKFPCSSHKILLLLNDHL
jgi:hypothetical protein